MKTKLFWSNCDLNKNKDSFWVECTIEDVTNKILPYYKDDIEILLKEIDDNKGANNFENESEYKYFFLISFDSEIIKSFQWQMPYSGLWNAGNPFEKIQEVKIKNLDGLKELRKN